VAESGRGRTDRVGKARKPASHWAGKAPLFLLGLLLGLSLLLAPARFGCLLVEALLGAANSLSCIVLTCFAMLE
jgi:hypothetical protein